MGINAAYQNIIRNIYIYIYLLHGTHEISNLTCKKQSGFKLTAGKCQSMESDIGFMNS